MDRSFSFIFAFFVLFGAAFPAHASLIPIQTTPGTFDFSKLTADKVLVIDPESKQVILERKSKEKHPLASLTKLMTALVLRAHGLDLEKEATVLFEDEVGGARLRVANGTLLTMRDVFYGMIVGSANNASHALARMTGVSSSSFIQEMNTRASALGLSSTTFADTSGLDLGNVSTAHDIAALALNAFDDPVIRSAATTAHYPLVVEGQTRQMKNTNGLLTDPHNGLYVLGGKTGYLVESKWNLAVKMMDSRKHPLLIVTLGSASNGDAFKDSARIGRWVWSHYEWKKPTPSLAATSAPISVSSPIPPRLQIGMRSEDVRTLQKKLTTYYKIPANTTSVTGYFGPKTYALVKRFQLKNGLITSDKATDAGYVGPKTASAVNAL